MRLALLTVGAALSLAHPTTALAQDRAPRQSLSAHQAAEAARFAPFSSGAVGGSSVKLRGGYDGASAKSDLHAEANAQLLQWLTVQVGATHDAIGTEARPFALGRLTLSKQASNGLDLTCGGGFEARGFNTEPSVLVAAAVGRRFGRLSLLSNLTYGQSIASPERNGSVTLAALLRVAERVQVGIDSQAQIDLERDAQEPEGELDWRALAGPFSTVTYGAFALTLGGGLSVLRYRLAPTIDRGGIAYVGVGAAL
jgi:hypothetical protein